MFDELLNVEEEFIQDGWAEGKRDADQRGYGEGFELGEIKGGQIGEEIGYYAGCVAAWAALAKLDPSILSENPRAEKTLQQLSELINAFPSDPTNELLFESLESIRAKFKQLVSLLKVKQRFIATARIRTPESNGDSAPPSRGSTTLDF